MYKNVFLKKGKRKASSVFIPGYFLEQSII